MSLLERSEILTKVIDELRTTRVAASQIQAIASRTASFAEADALLKAAAGRAGALQERGIDVKADVAAISSVRHNIVEWRARVSSDPSAAIGASGQTVQTQMLSPVKKMAAALQGGAAEAWQRHALSRLPKADPDTLKLMESLPGQATSVASFRELFARAKSLAETLPSTEAEYARFDQLALQCENAWRGFDTSDLPRAVQLFLRDVSSPSGASLELLNVEVSEWIRRHGWTEKFRIRAK